MKQLKWFYFKFLPSVLSCIVLSMAFNLLSLMQTKNMASFAAAVLTYLFALTALLYARARTTGDSEEIELRGHAADEALKVALIASVSMGLTAFIFFALGQDFKERPGHLLSGAVPETQPLIGAIFCILLFLPAIIKFERVIAMAWQDLERSKMRKTG